MKILVCVKRVPLTGGRIVLTEDAQAIETRHLGFTISPHEECGVEEAVRLVEQHGGESVVLTLGPADAEEQLRDAMAIGIDRGHPPRHRRRGVGSRGDRRRDRRRDPRRRGRDGAVRPRSSSATRPPTAGGYQVGLRVAYALGRPCATGLKSVVVEGGAVRCEQEVRGGRDVYELPLARRRDRAGRAQPAALPVGARAGMRAGRKPLDASTPARPDSRLERPRLVVPEGEAKQAEILGHGADAAPPSSTCSSRSGWHRESRPRRARRRRRRPTSRCRRWRSPPASAARSRRC